MRTFDKAVLWGLLLVIFTAVGAWLIFSKYFYRRLSLNQELQRQQAANQTEAAVTPEATPPNAKALEKSVDSFFMYHNQGVFRAEGKFQGTKGNNLLELMIDGEKKLFILKENTKLACQPTGLLTVKPDEESKIPANEVFIDDKRQQSIGVPWGIEIKHDEIVARVKRESETQVFYSSNPGFIPDLPEVAYVWFKSC